MTSDITIDTNIFMHAENNQEATQSHCIELISRLRSCSTSICVDEGFSVDEAKNRSQIGGEYWRLLPYGGLGYALVIQLAQLQRIKFLSKRVPPAIGKKINQLIHDPTDRVFVKISYNSTAKILTTHDYKNFPSAAKDSLRDDLEVIVLFAEDACAAI